MFDNFLFTPSEGQEGKYHLVCPICREKDPEPISGKLISVLQWRGECSTCVDCDKSANEVIPYWPKGEVFDFVYELSEKLDRMGPKQQIFMAGFLRGVLFVKRERGAQLEKAG